ncbi:MULTISPECIES: dihydroorotase [unclassified Variovorax]|uniref:dihydroorotase n=1 Tax=unclassified Variovorax TaxID=663243 RepID=UPI002577D7B4|nr:MULTISPECIES: dihydroorotase [unclassified Variovorax]MDM0089560.1 dihydroorotase [Variovorax sp. J22G40]MDM0147632.1 dihydroorotase [Variovorax sp. J2P1-31]
MNILITHGRVVDPASGLDQVADVAIADGRILALGATPAGFQAERTLDAAGCIVAPGLVDLAARLREPGYEHEGMLDSEMAAAVAGGVTSLVCPPDTDPVLDEPGLVEMLTFRAEKLRRARLFPLGAVTRGLAGEVLTEMVALTEAGCVGFSQADVPLASTQVLQRALSYAATFGYTVWLRPQDRDLGKGVAASGALATRLGLSGVPVAAETIALFTIFELMKSSGARVHLCRLSSAAGVALVRAAKAEGLPLSCDVSINSLHLTENDIGYFDSRARLNPPLRQQRDRDALSAGLADGTIDALVSDHTPVEADAKTLPFAESEPGATGLELLLPLALQWGEQSGAGLMRALEVVSAAPAQRLGAPGIGRLAAGGPADLCVIDPAVEWQVQADALRSQGKHTPFAGYAMRGQARFTLVGGRIVHST